MSHSAADLVPPIFLSLYERDRRHAAVQAKMTEQGLDVLILPASTNRWEQCMADSRYVTGIGANAEAVRRAGIDIRRVTLAVYMLSGGGAALAGIIIAARLGSGSSNAGGGFELDVIAAVVLGGTSLFGGRGSMVGTMLGALTVAVIGNGLILAHLSPFLTPIVTGIIILIAIWLNFRLFRTGRKNT